MSMSLIIIAAAVVGILFLAAAVVGIVVIAKTAGKKGED